MVQNPGFQFRSKSRTCGSDGLRGWRHGIRRAHKVTIDLAARIQEAEKRHNGLGSHSAELDCSETPPGFHASLGRVKPCTLELKRRCGTELTLSTRRVPFRTSFTGCRGHPCRRKFETHRGFHFNQVLLPLEFPMPSDS